MVLRALVRNLLEYVLDERCLSWMLSEVAHYRVPFLLPILSPRGLVSLQGAGGASRGATH